VGSATDRCSRCGVGVDDDGDGDCAVCASATNSLIRALQHERYLRERAERGLHDLIVATQLDACLGKEPVGA
jgi:hypothetical protein